MSTILNKPFTTYRQQLKILRKRNLDISNGSKAILILKREGYYNIINGYKDIFLDIPKTKSLGEDFFKVGTTFENIFSLYDFDRNIRSILIKYLLKFETALKTKISYHFSEHFTGNFSYLDINNFDTSNPQKVTKLIARLSTVITNNSQPQDQGGQIYHYINKYKELPLWVLIKKMTLGETYHFFDALTPDMKKEIVDEFISDYQKIYPSATVTKHKNYVTFFHEMLMLLNHFRNVCAHDERLYNVVFKKGGNMPKIILFHKQTSFSFKSKLFDCILILGLLLQKKDYQRLYNQMVSELSRLSEKLPQNLFNAVLLNMGFPKNWKSDLKIP